MKVLFRCVKLNLSEDYCGWAVSLQKYSQIYCGHRKVTSHKIHIRLLFTSNIQEPNIQNLSSDVKSSRGLTTVVTVTVGSNKDVQAYEGQQRPLEFGTGSVKHRTEGSSITHVKLVGMSRQHITDTQKSLEQRNGITLQRERSRHEVVVQPSPDVARWGQRGRGSDAPTHRTDAAVASGPHVSPKSHVNLKKGQLLKFFKSRLDPPCLCVTNHNQIFKIKLCPLTFKIFLPFQTHHFDKKKLNHLQLLVVDSYY